MRLFAYLFLLIGVASTAIGAPATWDRFLCQNGYARVARDSYAPRWEVGSLEERKPYAALGISGGLYVPGEPLEDFARAQSARLRHQVVSHKDFVSAGLLKKKGISVSRYVEEALTRAVEVSPGKKSIFFNLTDLRFDHVLRAGWGPRPDNITEQELRLILGREDLFEATSWWRDGRELSREEVCRLFSALPEVCRGEWDALQRMGYGETSVY